MIERVDFREDNPTVAIALHRTEWALLAKNPLLPKEEALTQMGYEPFGILHMCFLCEFSAQVAQAHRVDFDGKERCQFCPVVWPAGCCTNMGTYPLPKNSDYIFKVWSKTDSIILKTKLAEQIRDLPEKRKEVGFDGLGVEEHSNRFSIYATKNGEYISSPYICDIMKDGSGMSLAECLNSDVFTTGYGGTIKLLNP